MVVITRRDWLFIGVANAVALGIALVSAHFALGWKAAAASVVVTGVMLAAFCLTHREPFFLRLFVFGLAMGFTELVNDTYLVDRQLLVYAPGGPFVLDTPLYMPFSWALLVITNGSIAAWLWGRLGPRRSPLAMAVVSGLYIPGFEALAAKADWWHYQHVPFWLGAPAFVVVGEALLALPLPWMCTTLASRRFAVAIGLGVVEGLVVFLTTLVALRLVG